MGKDGSKYTLAQRATSSINYWFWSQDYIAILHVRVLHPAVVTMIINMPNWIKHIICFQVLRRHPKILNNCWEVLRETLWLLPLFFCPQSQKGVSDVVFLSIIKLWSHIFIAIGYKLVPAYHRNIVQSENLLEPWAPKSIQKLVSAWATCIHMFNKSFNSISRYFK